MDKTEFVTPAHLMARTCALAPQAAPDLKPAVLQAVEAAQATARADYLGTLGAILYRSGEPEVFG